MPLLNGDSVAAGCSQVPSSLGRNPFGFCCVLTGLAEDESMTDRLPKTKRADERLAPRCTQLENDCFLRWPERNAEMRKPGLRQRTI